MPSARSPIFKFQNQQLKLPSLRSSYGRQHFRTPRSQLTWRQLPGRRASAPAGKCTDLVLPPWRAVLLNHHAQRPIVRVARTFAIAGHDSEPGPEYEPPPRKFELIVCSMRPLRLGPGLFACFGSCPGTPCSVPVSLRLVLARAAALRVRSALSGATRILNLKMTRCGYWCSLNFTLIIHGRTPTDMRRLCFFHVLVRVGARRGCGIIIAQRFCATRRGDIPSRRLGRTRFFLSLSRSKPYGYPRAGVFVSLVRNVLLFVPGSKQIQIHLSSQFTHAPH